MSQPTSQKRLLIVDDHPMVREWFAQLIGREPGLVVCGEASDAPQTLAAIEKLRPDMVLLDLALDGAHGTDLVNTIARCHPGLLILVVSMHDESLYAERAIYAGAHGYITKREAGKRIKQAIRCVLDGGIYVSKAVDDRILHRAVGGLSRTSLLECLSDRELETFRLLGNGWGPSQIAEELHVSVKSVEVYMARIKEKFGLKNARELHQYAIQHRVVSEADPSSPSSLPSPGPWRLGRKPS